MLYHHLNAYSSCDSGSRSTPETQRQHSAGTAPQSTANKPEDAFPGLVGSSCTVVLHCTIHMKSGRDNWGISRDSRARLLAFPLPPSLMSVSSLVCDHGTVDRSVLGLQTTSSAIPVTKCVRLVSGGEKRALDATKMYRARRTPRNGDPGHEGASEDPPWSAGPITRKEKPGLGLWS